MKNTSLYAIIGVSPTASIDEIRQAYRVMVKRYHPDLFPSFMQRLWATQQMQQINDAYRILRDPITRQEYDNTHRELFNATILNSKNSSPKVATRLFQLSWKENKLFTFFRNIGEIIYIPALLLISAIVGFAVDYDGANDYSSRKLVRMFLKNLLFSPVYLLLAYFACALTVYLAGILVLLVKFGVIDVFRDSFSKMRYFAKRRRKFNVWTYLAQLMIIPIAVGIGVAFYRPIALALLMGYWFITIPAFAIIISELLALIFWFFYSKNVQKIINEAENSAFD